MAQNFNNQKFHSLNTMAQNFNIQKSHSLNTKVRNLKVQESCSLNCSRFSRSKSSDRHHNRSRHSMSQSSERSTLRRESPKRLNKGSEHSRSYDRPCSRLSVESTPTLPSLSKRKQHQSSTDSFPMTEESEYS